MGSTTPVDALEAAAAIKAQAEKERGTGRTKEAPLFHGTDTLAVSDLHWYTTADDIISVASRAGVELKRKDVVFAEHKVNGKTKGSAVISCHSEDGASRLAYWFHNNDFQGKRTNPSFVNPATGHPFKSTTGGPGHRPVLNTQILLAHGPTNAHGGVNFNRVKPARLAQQVQAHAVQALGMGWPTGMYKTKPYQDQHPDQMDGRHMGHTLYPHAHPFVPAGLDYGQ